MRELLPVPSPRPRDIGFITCSGDVLISNAKLPGDLRHRSGPDQIVELRAGQSHRSFSDSQDRNRWSARLRTRAGNSYPKTRSRSGAIQLSTLP